MQKSIVINSDPKETRVAILEDKQLVELLVERPDERRIVGDIYKGKVNAVLPGMQAAFVEIGLAKTAFLHASDLSTSGLERRHRPRRRGGRRRSRPRRRRAPRRPRPLLPPQAPLRGGGQDRGAPDQGSGSRGPGDQGAHLHQGAAGEPAALAARPLRGVHARRRPRRRLPQDPQPRRAPAPEAHPARGAPQERRGDRAHRGRRTIQGGVRRGHRVPGHAVDEDRAPRAVRAGARRHPSRAVPGHRSHPRRPHRGRGRGRGGLARRVRGDPRLPAHLLARSRQPRAPLPRQAPHLRRVPHRGGDREALRAQGVAQARRVHRHRPGRGPHRDRREHRPLRGQEEPGRDHPQDQHRGGPGDHAPASPARRRRDHRARLHRHGVGGEQEGGAGGTPQASRSATGAAPRPSPSPSWA